MTRSAHEYRDGEQIRFGKYRGRPIDEVIADDPAYVSWACEEGVIDLDDQMGDLLRQSLKR